MTHREKFARAGLHIAAVQRLLVEYRDASPFAIRMQDQRGAPSHPRHLLVGVMREEDLPRELPLVVGDALFNLRSSLDHLAFALARRYAGAGMKDRHAFFPIIDDPAAWTKPSGGLKRALALFAPRVRSELERLQPFSDPSGVTGNPLHVLDELNNRDKHRHLVFHGALSAEALFDLQPDARDIRIASVFPPGVQRIEAEERFFTAELEAIGPNPRYGVKAQLVMSFTLPEDGPAPGADLLPLLGSLTRHIETVVYPALEPHLL